MAETMVERVARAIEEAVRVGYFTTGSDGMSMSRHAARAAIAAMREPTEAMVEAYVTGNDQLYRDPAITALRGTAKAKAKARFRWNAGIDAALAYRMRREDDGAQVQHF